jgi:hypothetical protein
MILGDERFEEKVMERYDKGVGQKRKKKEYKLSDIAAGIEETYGITLKQIREKGKKKEICWAGNY